MRRKIALFTEWAWANGLLSNPNQMRAFSHLVYTKIKEHYPHAHGYQKLAVLELERDIWKVLKILSYGGKKPTELSTARVEYLTQTSHDFFKAA